MKNKIITNITASIKAKLINYAKQNNKTVDFVYLQYCQERLLYRLSQSQYKNNFILKGGLSLLALEINKSRPTKDIDFLAVLTKNDFYEIENIFREIINLEFDDGVIFENDIKLEEIKKDAEYQGIRVKINAKLERSKSILSIDIGFGDKILGNAKEILFPVILSDLKAPLLKTYPIESIIAEKFQAMVVLNYQNSRFKDFYDILFLAENYHFEIKNLNRAINKTFTYRETYLKEREIIFSDKFKNDTNMKNKWQQFLKLNKLDCYLSFFEVITKLELFLNFACEDINSNFIWNFNLWKWEAKK